MKRKRNYSLDEEIFGRDFSSFVKMSSYFCVVAVLIFALFLMLSVFKISSYTFNTYDNIEDLPHNKVGLLLGTSPKEVTGQPNEYFTYRILAAVELFNAKKIDYILVSGDNRHESYNEPREMQRSLLKAGIPQDRIIFDFAGISTLDSVIRANKVFLQEKFTIISQEFHNERALFIADHHDIKAVGFNALDPDDSFLFSKVAIRELFARIKCIFDVYFLNTAPKFLGDPITIGASPLPKEISNKPRYPTSKPKLATDNAKALKAKEELFEAIKIEKQLPPPENDQLSDEAIVAESQAKTNYFVSSEDEALNAELMAEEQNKALEESKAQAFESLSSGNQTYIDPNKEVNNTNKEENNKNNNTRRLRPDIEKSHGDPWDFY